MLGSAIAGIAYGGGAYAVLAVAMILLYRTTGVLNFAIAAVGAFGTFVTSVLYGQGWAVAPAALVGILTGAALSVAFGLVFVRWYFDASVRHRSTVAISLLLGTISVDYLVFGEQPRFLPNFVAGNVGSIFGVVVPAAGVVAVVVAIVVAGGLAFALGRTRIGRLIRGIAQGPVTCELLGVPVRALSVGAWAVSGMLGTVAMLLVAPGQTSDSETLGLMVVPGLAAALIARFSSYTVAVLAGIAIGVAQGVLDYYNSLRVYESVIPFVVILGLMLWFERKEVWDEVR